MSTPTDFSKLTMSQLNQYIKFADQKASILLTGQLAFIGFYANLITTFWGKSKIWFKFFSITTIVATILASVITVWVVYPQTKSSGTNLLFWGDIQNKYIKSYQTAIKNLDEEAALEEIIEENHLLSDIANKKYSRLKLSLKLTLCVISLSIISTILLL